MEYPVLYKDGRFWRIYIKEDGKKAYIYTEYGKINGKITKPSPQIIELCKGKSAIERAKQLAKTKWQNKITISGFSTSQQSQKYIPFYPMKPVDWEKFNDKINYPAYLQPKLDGVRMFALLGENGKIQMLSRQNKPIFNITHLENHLKDVFKKYPDIVLDGELLIGKPYEQKELRGILAKKYLDESNKNKIDKISYHIFDLVERNNMDESFHNRWKLAEKIAKQYKDITIVPTYIVENKEDVNKMFNSMIEKGFEGAIIRNMNAQYRMGKQSQDVQKIKLYFMDEFEIVGFTEGTGNNKGTVIWEVKCLKNPNRKFKVKPMGSREIKRKLYENADKHIGKKLQVFFYEKDEDGCVVRIKTAEDISQK